MLTAARAFAAKEFRAERDYALVQHTDEKHPHIHIVVQMQVMHGLRLNPRKADLQRRREGFAEQLRERGIEATATPRRARGITLKP